ncbi:hypothetical protein KCP71_21960 [Salmonella enterica subsp. enterica]|nr:hypothetical protein KCP71_21960 [Salmonella enterica subsp. enterica]
MINANDNANAASPSHRHSSYESTLRQSFPIGDRQQSPVSRALESQMPLVSCMRKAFPLFDKSAERTQS